MSAAQQRAVLPATLLVVMVAGVFQLMVFSILAAPLIDDIGLSRTQLGLVGSVNTLVGAMTAPFSGRVADRIGPGRSVVLSLLVASLGMAVLALAPGLGWIYVAAAIGGLPQGSTNPATNALISSRVDPGRRGTLTGIKQSGVTLAGFLAGVTLPALESRFGWRGASWAYAGAFLAAAVAVQFLLHRDPPRPTAAERATAAANDQPIDSIIYWITAYAFFMGLASGAIGRFLPLYAEEKLGFSTGVAGLIVALAGLLGMGARIAAARLAEHRISPTRLLPVLSVVGAGFALMLALLTTSTRGLLWLAPILNAIGTNAWNAVAMLAVIMFVSTAKAGKASGIVMVGFLGGLAVSGPTTGRIVDATGSYTIVWVGATVVSLCAAALMVVTDRRSSDRLAP